MTREEAIEKIREAMPTLWKETIDAIQTLIPELRESEDERIRRKMIEHFKSKTKETWCNMPVKDIIAYLEKQKEQKPPITGNDFGWIDELKHDLEHPEELDQKVDDVLKQRKGIRALEQKPAEWKPQPESLEALMYAIEGEWDKIKPTSYLSRRLEDLYEGLVNTFNVDESLLAELPKTAYSAKDIEELRVLKDKIEASMEAPVDKPAEWSEEDEEMRGTCIDLLEHFPRPCGEVIGPWKDCIVWLKSLRPQPKSNVSVAITPNKEFFKWIYDRLVNVHKENPNVDYMISFKKRIEELSFDKPSWKPSEEQMEALGDAYVEANTFKNGDILESLYNDLKKL